MQHLDQGGLVVVELHQNGIQQLLDLGAARCVDVLEDLVQKRSRELKASGESLGLVLGEEAPKLARRGHQVPAGSNVWNSPGVQALGSEIRSRTILRSRNRFVRS